MSRSKDYEICPRTSTEQDADTHDLVVHGDVFHGPVDPGLTRFQMSATPLRLIVVLIVVFSFAFVAGILSTTWLLSQNLTQQSLVSSYNNSSLYRLVYSHQLVSTPFMHTGVDNPYAGEPTNEKDALWADLLKGYNIRVPQSDLNPRQPPSIQLSDGSGDAWMSLGLYHHLHCLDSIRHTLSGYGCKTWDSTVGHDGFPAHLDHCIETLRQWVMCQPDLSFRSIQWRSDGLSAFANNSVTHQCIDWSVLMRWIDGQTIQQDGGLVKQPNGTIFKDVRPPPPRCAKIAQPAA